MSRGIPRGVYIKGMVQVSAGAAPAFTGNTGMFATVARPGAGDYDITIDPDTPIDPDDTVKILVEGTLALGTSVTRTSATAITCNLINAAGVAADPSTGFAIIIKGLLPR